VSAKFQVPRGTHDVLPSGQPLWQKVVQTAEEVSRIYGYGRIQTPGFEDTDLFQRTSGGGSDIVQKEMYTFTDRGDRSLTLRPEGTAPNARAYLEHGLHRDPQPVKTYMIAPMYRYAAPQRGRYREHYQWSVEAVGSSDPAVDAELIQLYVEFLRRLGVSRYWIALNSIGDANCRPAYLERLNAWLDAHANVLDEEARQKRATSPLRVFDVKNERVRAALIDAPKIGESLCDACSEHFAQVRSYLDSYGVEYRIVPTLVRGLDYYTRTTFEFMGDALGEQTSIVGGGRYDRLLEQIGGPPTPGIGFGAGVERLLIQLEEEGVTAEPTGLDVFFVVDGAPRERVLGVMAELRRVGVSCDTDYAGRSLKGQMTQAGRAGAATIVAVRDDDATIRRGGRDELVVSLDEVVATLSP
jgi:histidyl-tRNA synthetase